MTQMLQHPKWTFHISQACRYHAISLILVLTCLPATILGAKTAHALAVSTAPHALLQEEAQERQDAKEALLTAYLDLYQETPHTVPEALLTEIEEALQRRDVSVLQFAEVLDHASAITQNHAEVIAHKCPMGYTHIHVMSET